MSDSDFALIPAAYAQLVGWSEDDPAVLIPALLDCLSYIKTVKPYRTGALGLTADDLLPLLIAATQVDLSKPGAARRFFERHCLPFTIRLPETLRGFVTGFYEPEVDVSEHRDEVYRYPFYRRPTDLVELDEQNRPPTIDPSYVFARSRDGLFDLYPDRRQIDGGYLAGKNLEIAWAKSKIDVFFAHIQGAARLRHRDGRLQRITYDGKAGHAFSPIGRLLIERGELDAADISMQSIRSWLRQNPAKMDEVLWHNRSYIFFRETGMDLPEMGPIAAAKVPLVAGRSLAVDRMVHTFGFPFFIQSESLTHLDGGQPFARTMLALDTGSAIVGPARGDIFTGSGAEAGEQAGTIRHAADFHILIPRAAAARFLP